MWLIADNRPQGGLLPFGRELKVVSDMAGTASHLDGASDSKTMSVCRLTIGVAQRLVEHWAIGVENIGCQRGEASRYPM